MPSFFSAFQLALGAALACGCYRSSGHRVWVIVTLILGYMAIDQLFAIHERVGTEVRAIFGACPGEECQLEIGPTTTAYWVVVFVPFVAVFGGALFLGLRSILARRDLCLLILAAAIFLLGAVGFESWQVYGRSLDEQWFRTEIGQRVLLAEEGLEMIGVTLAVMVLKAYRPLVSMSDGTGTSCAQMIDTRPRHPDGFFRSRVASVTRRTGCSKAPEQMLQGQFECDDRRRLRHLTSRDRDARRCAGRFRKSAARPRSRRTAPFRLKVS